MPFCQTTLKAKRPRIRAYPEELKTIGDHIRKRRLDLGLLQKDVGRLVGVDTTTVTNWEKGRTGPTNAWVIPAGQRRKADAVDAVNELFRQGLEIHVADAALLLGVIAGHDPQLEAAIRIILQELEKNPPQKPKRPEYPIRGNRLAER